jgi:hypothetical protein
MVATTEVELGEEQGALELVQELFHHWNREFVPNGLHVEGVIINTKAP